jgi:lipopolysaccharide/colanic/teichoic acid biosynthesis glycosyltransferase
LKKQKLPHWILAGDLLWMVVSLPLAYLLRCGFHRYGPEGDSFQNYLPLLIAGFVLWSGIFVWMQLDGFRRGWDLSAIMSQLFLAISLLMMILMTGGYLLRVFVSRLTLIYFALLLFSGFICLRYFVNAALGSKYLAKAVRRVLIVGNGVVAREMATKIARHPEMLCQVVGFLYSSDTSLDPRIAAASAEASTVPTMQIVSLLRDKQIDEVIITLSGHGSQEVTNLANQCRREGIGVSVVPQPYELYLSRPQLLDIGGLPVLQLCEPKANAASTAIKRSFDIAVGSVLMIICTPIVAMGAIPLFAKRGGPFIRELRCGKLGKRFWMYRLNSDRDAVKLARWERGLQQLSITEMPQLLNVLLGNMSLVGPRPESPERVRHYSEWQRQRLKVLPGITGLAQVQGLRQQHSSEEKTRFDLQYLIQASLFQDVSLILQTLWTLAGRLLHAYRLGTGSGTGRTPPADPSGIVRAIERNLSSAHSAQSSAD